MFLVCMESIAVPDVLSPCFADKSEELFLGGVTYVSNYLRIVNKALKLSFLFPDDYYVPFLMLVVEFLKKHS